MNGHITRYSDSSLYDEKCVNCGATDNTYQGLIKEPCPYPGHPYKTTEEYYKTIEQRQKACLKLQ
jgi:hypothetical protein